MQHRGLLRIILRHFCDLVNLPAPGLRALSPFHPTVPRMLRRSPRRTRRGFTLLETIVALGVSSVLLVALVLWVSSIMRTTTIAIEMVGTTRDARFIAARLEEDLMRATSCDPAGFAPVWSLAGPTEIAFFADVVDSEGVPASDGLADQVTWRVVAGVLERGVEPGTGSCPQDPLEPSIVLELTGGVAALDDAAFFTVYEGGTARIGEESCLAASAECRFETVRIRASVVEEGPDDAPSTLDATFDVSRATQRR